MIYCPAVAVWLCLLIGTEKELTFCGLLLMGQIFIEHALTTIPNAHNSFYNAFVWVEYVMLRCFLISAMYLNYFVNEFI